MDPDPIDIVIYLAMMAPFVTGFAWSIRSIWWPVTPRQPHEAPHKESFTFLICGLIVINMIWVPLAHMTGLLS